MNQPQDFTSVVEDIVKEDVRYRRGAYYFVREALDYTVKNLKPTIESSGAQHVTAQTLLEGIREFALQQYGPMTKTVFNYWRIFSCEDFGEIVFTLVEFGVFGKTDQDNRADFVSGYDFHEAFEKPFLPSKEHKRPRKND